MQEHSMTLQEDEFKLLQKIRKMNGSAVIKKKFIAHQKWHVLGEEEYHGMYADAE